MFRSLTQKALIWYDEIITNTNILCVQIAVNYIGCVLSYLMEMS